MNKFFTTKRICRAAVIAALYVALTFAFAPFAYGPIQIRPAEALCILPLLFPESIFGLFIGCMLSNLLGYGFFDVLFGSLTTLIAAFITYLVGKYIKNTAFKIFLGGFPAVLLNALVIPIIIVYITGNYTSAQAAAAAYFSCFISLAITQAIWVYGLGSLLFFALRSAALYKK